MPAIYLPPNASRARIIEAERARDNRREIIREQSWGRVSRRELFKWGLLTSAGLLAPINGLNPFVRKSFADEGHIPRSPLFGVQPFTQPMHRFDVLARNAVGVPEIGMAALNRSGYLSAQSQVPRPPMLKPVTTTFF